MNPFLSFYTPTYRRPTALAACMASVGKQDPTLVEHIIVADYLGLGIAGMYAKVPYYADALHGDYVHFLADDDVLANPTVVAQVKEFAFEQGYPLIILVDVIKHGIGTISPVWPPVEGSIDLGNLIVRGDVWQRHCGDYGQRYEGDADFAKALHANGYDAVRMDLLFLTGGISQGRPEVVA